MFLIDTHTLIWFLYNDDRLPETVNEKLKTSKNVYVSIVSIWEIAIKQGIGKLIIANTPSGIVAACNSCDISILHIQPGHLDLLKDLPMIHKDPFDRLIIAQAMNDGFTIITRDSNISKYQVDTIW